MFTKICNQCNLEKNTDEFYKQEKINKHGESYIYTNPKCKTCIIENYLLWKNENKEKHKLNNSKHYLTAKGRDMKRKNNRKIREDGKFRAWQQNNPDKISNYRVNRQHKSHDITKSEWERCKEYFDNACAYCGTTEDGHRINFKQDLHREHIDPEGKNDITNCVPSCKSCNSSKHTFSLGEWYNSTNENFTVSRSEKIKKWIILMKI